MIISGNILPIMKKMRRPAGFFTLFLPAGQNFMLYLLLEVAGTSRGLTFKLKIKRTSVLNIKGQPLAK